MDEGPPFELFTEIAFGDGVNAGLHERSMACLAAFVGGFQAIIESESGANTRTRELLLTSGIRELEPLAMPMAWRIDRLHTQSGPDGGGPQPADAYALGRCYGTLRAKVADPGMRHALHNAVVHAFDADPYRGGETLGLLQTLATLRAGDLDRLQGSRRGAPDERDARLVQAGLCDDAGDRTESGDGLVALIGPVTDQVPDDWTPPWERGVAISLELDEPTG